MDIDKMMTESEIEELFDSMGLRIGDSLNPRESSAAEKWARYTLFSNL